MLVLSWNLFHGRSVPDRPHDLEHEFTALLAGWTRDVALLQEVPPWWPEPLADACGARAERVLTSRNAGLCLRRVLATRRPDILRSSGGGANAILVRPGAGSIDAAARRRLRLRPERRVVHAVRLAGGELDGTWIANIHAQAGPRELARADLHLAGETVLRWAAGAPVALGGDLNVPDPAVDRFSDAGGHHLDRLLLTAGLRLQATPRRLDRHGLSDHEPVLFDLVRSAAERPGRHIRSF